MRNSKWIAFLLAFAMIFGSFAFAFADDEPLVISPNPAAGPDDIVILHTNDVHCGYEAYDKLAALAKTADLLVDAGDSIQGGPIGTLSKGEYIVEIMNEIGYDVAAPGNHEFDYGLDQFQKIAGQLAKFPYVCCNLVDLRSGKPLFEAYKIFEIKGKKIAFVGIDTPETFYKSTPTFFQDEKGNYIYSFSEGNDGQDLYDAVQKAVDAAKAEGAEYIIALAHLGIDEESAPWRVTDVAAKTKGIDAFIDGHSHSVFSKTVKNAEGKDVLIQQTGTKLENVGKITIAADGTISGENIVTADVTADQDAAAFIEKISARVEALTNEVVAKTEVELTTKNEDGSRAVRSKETNLGDLCADAYLNVMDAQIAFVNGGGVRADIPAGDISYGQILNVHPFGNMACLVEVTGQQVMDALELGYSALPGESGGFLQVAGLTCTVNTAIDSPVVRNDQGEFVKVEGQRRVSDILIGGEPIDPAKTYQLASHNYMLKNGGDGYAMFGKDNVKLIRDEVLIDNQVLINYIVDDLGGVVGEAYAQPQGRVNIIDDPSKVEAKPVAKVFSDVEKGVWYEKYLQAAYDNKIIGGFPEGDYRPEGNLTHAQIMVMAANLHSKQKGDSFKAATAAEGTHWASPYLEYCKAEGIVDSRFDAKLDEQVNRGEMAYYFANTLTAESYKEKQSLEFSDVKGNEYEAAIMKLAKADIVGGKGNGIYDPNALVKRSEAAVFISNILDAIGE